MSGPDLSSLIPRSSPLEAGSYSVAGIVGFGRHFVGRDHEGRACILLASTDVRAKAPIRLGGLDVQYALPCVVSLADGVREQRTLTVVTCTGGTADAERYFLHVVGTLVVIVGVSPTLLQLAEAITQVAGIFQRLVNAPREGVAGVIGELIVISCSSDAIAAIAGWRTDPTERYDFVSGDVRLEVKSSLVRKRAHSFSFEQCDVPTGTHGLVASLFVEASAGGTSLDQLLARIVDRLPTSPESIFTLHQTLASTLGAGLNEALSFSFDDQLARASLCFYDLRSIPAIRTPIDPAISQVRFVADLSQTLSLDVEAVSKQLSDFRVFRPLTTQP